MKSDSQVQQKKQWFIILKWVRVILYDCCCFVSSEVICAESHLTASTEALSQHFDEEATGGAVCNSSSSIYGISQMKVRI